MTDVQSAWCIAPHAVVGLMHATPQHPLCLAAVSLLLSNAGSLLYPCLCAAVHCAVSRLPALRRHVEDHRRRMLPESLPGEEGDRGRRRALCPVNRRVVRRQHAILFHRLWPPVVESKHAPLYIFDRESLMQHTAGVHIWLHGPGRESPGGPASSAGRGSRRAAPGMRSSTLQRKLYRVGPNCEA